MGESELAKGDGPRTPIEAERPHSVRRGAVAVSTPPTLPDAVYDEIADALIAAADRIASSESEPNTSRR